MKASGASASEHRRRPAREAPSAGAAWRSEHQGDPAARQHRQEKAGRGQLREGKREPPSGTSGAARRCRCAAAMPSHRSPGRQRWPERRGGGHDLLQLGERAGRTRRTRRGERRPPLVRPPPVRRRGSRTACRSTIRAWSCFTQPPSHQHPGPMELPLRRARRDVQQLGDLAMLVAFDVVEHENLARPRRQLVRSHGRNPLADRFAPAAP